MLARPEVRLLENWPQPEGTKTKSPMARKINDAVAELIAAGIEPEQIVINIDHRAVIIHEDKIIHLRVL